MSLFKDIGQDLEAAHRFGQANKIALFFFNRGFHALLWYRVAHRLAKWHVPLLPFIFSRFIQILYGIDIDFNARLSGGLVIVHGVGLVVGQEVVIKDNVILFHGVTLGRRGVGPIVSKTDGYPTVNSNSIICAGAKLIGKIVIGENCIIGANCVVSQDILPNSVCKLPHESNIIYQRTFKTV